MTQQNAAKNQISFSWLKFNIYTRWETVTKHTFLVVFDPVPSLKEEILSSFAIPERTANQPDDLEDPYWVHVQILEHVIRLQDAAVWAVRDLVRAVETSRATVAESSGANLDYARHHDIARHAIHVSETTALSIKTTEHILALHRDFSDQLSFKSAPNRSKYICGQIHKQLCFFEHMMHSLALRSTATRDRLLNEIQLAFNVVSQIDSHTSVTIGRAAQYDSYSMRSVAFLTLTFLPATFVSALFSMSFFTYDPGSGWIVSEKLWLYFAIAGPLTGISLMLWLAWQKLFPPESLNPIPKGYRAPSWGEKMTPCSMATTRETRESRMDMQAYELNAV